MSFSFPPDGWNVVNGNDTSWGTDVLEDTTQVLSGSYSIKWPNGGLANVALRTDLIPIIPGRYYKTSRTFRASAVDGDNSADYIVAGYDEDGVYIDDVAANTSIVQAANTWEHRSDVFYVPTDMRYLTILVARGGGTNFDLWLDHALLNVSPGILQVYLNTNQSIANNTNTTVLFDGLTNGDNYDSSTGKFTAPYAGMWSFVATYNWDTINAGIRLRGQFHVNGTLVAENDFHTNVASATPCHQCASGLLKLEQDDEVEVKALQVSGGAVNLVAAQTNCWFRGYEVL